MKHPRIQGIQVRAYAGNTNWNAIIWEDEIIVLFPQTPIQHPQIVALWNTTSELDRKIAWPYVKSLLILYGCPYEHLTPREKL